jgi:acetylornithine deacetylase/succinyl-diaminopimelate desuccinylase-like protein
MRLSVLMTLVGLAQLSTPMRGQSDLSAHIQEIPWERYQDQSVRLLQEYLRIDTANPPGNEQAAAEFFKRLFDEAGIPNTLFSYAPGRANLFAILKGDGSLRPLILLNHTDVVRAEPQNWRVPPFSSEIVDGEIYGRGAVDMKDEGMIHAMVMLIAAKERLPLKRDLIFLATADEEVGGTGSAWMIENHPELLRGAEYLITEGGANLVDPADGTVYGVATGEKAPFWLRLTARGRGGHGSMPIADSATHRLARALQRVVDWQTPIRLLPTVEQFFHELSRRQPEPRARKFRNLRQSLRDPAFAKSLSADEKYNYMLRDTISLTVLTGSTQTNVIPDTASAELDVRLLPGSDPGQLLEELRKVVADDKIEIQPTGQFRTPSSSPADTTLFRTIREAVLRYNPQALVVPALNSGYTESQMYRPLGIHCYGFAPVEITPQIDASQHASNERIPVEQVRRGVKLLYEIVARVVSEP